MDPIHPISSRRKLPSPVEVVMRQPRTSLRERDEREQPGERRRRPAPRPAPPAAGGVRDDGGEPHIDVLA